MPQYNFEGAIENISERQLEFIHNVIIQQGFEEDSKAVFEVVGKAGDNYSATVKRLTVHGNNKTLKMIVKIAPTVEANRMLMNSFMLFRNEHIMYTEVLPKLVQLQKEAGVPEEEHLKYAKCYGSLPEQPNEVILLEDLQTLDFTVLDRFTSLTDECVKSVLKNFAILHSLSYVLKDEEPETYENFKINLIDRWAVMGGAPEAKVYFQALEDDTIAIFKDTEYTNILRHTVVNVLNLSVKFAKADRNNKYTVIQQGDSWTNNMMFKFEGEKLIDSIMIDYQVSKSTSPVCDIMYMIFNCTDYYTRKQHYYDWIDYYHSELEKSLLNFNLKVNNVYPRDKLDTDLKQYGQLQFGLSIVVASMLIRKSDDAAKIVDAMNSENLIEQAQDLGVSTLDEDSRTRFKNRVIGLINSFTEFGYLT